MYYTVLKAKMGYGRLTSRRHALGSKPSLGGGQGQRSLGLGVGKGDQERGAFGAAMRGAES